MSCRTWFLGLAAGAASLLHAVDPWAVWTDFTGAGAEGGLAPQVSSVQNNIDGGAWRFRLAGKASVDPVGALHTGTTAAPHIDFGENIDLGYDNNPFTVVMAVRNVGTTTGKPLCIAGSSIGMALTAINKTAGTATIKGMWNNEVWNNGNNVARSVDTLPGTGVTVLAMNCAGSSSSGGVTVKTVGASGVTSLDTWNGLRGSSLNIQHIFFGNTNNATSGGLDFELLAVAVYRGMPADAEVVAAVAQMPSVATSEVSGSDAWSFADVTGVTRQEVTVTAASSPSAFTVNNTTTDYVIGGAAIGGATRLRKQGSGTLWLKGANTFSGGVVIEGGRVVETAKYTSVSSANALGTGKASGGWANKITLRNGIFDLNNAQNYYNVNQSEAHWGWLSLQTLTLGGMADSTMEITGGVFGIGTGNAITYDATNNPGKATISANYVFTGSSSNATRTLAIGDSSATDIEVEFTGGMHANTWVDGQNTTIEKTGAGTMKVSCGFGFYGLKVTGGTVLMGQDYAFMDSVGGGKFTALTLNGGTLDLGSTTQAFAPSAITLTSGSLVASEGGTLELSEGTYSGNITGTMNVTATGALSLTGTVSTSGTLRVAPGASLTLSAMPENARIVVDCSALAESVNGTVFSPLVIPGEVDETRITWEGYDERFFQRTRTETGAYTITINRTQKHILVMPMGDSITEGSGTVENAPSYRKALAEQMMAAGMNPRFTGARIYKSSPIANEDCHLHTGLSGQRVQTVGGRGGFLQGAPNWLEQAGYPDAITLMIGTNDSTTATGDQAKRDAETVFGRWKTLVKQMVDLRPNTWIIVSPITPTRQDRTDITPYTTAYNTLIKGLFTVTESTITVNGEEVPCVLGELNEEGKAAFGETAKVRMASMYDAIPAANNTIYFYDNLHPSQAGYDRMAAVWLEAIKQVCDGERGGLTDAEAIVDAYQTAGALDSVTVVFNQDQPTAEGFTVNGVAPASAELSADLRRVTLTLATALSDGDSVSVVRDDLSATFTAKGATAANRVPSALLEGYTKVKTLAVPEAGSFHTAEAVAGAFTELPEAAAIQNFDRVGYYVTLARPTGQLRYLWVSMETPYATIDALGLPQDSLRAKVGNLRVATNMPGIDEVREDGVEGLIQFGPHSLSTTAADSNAPASLGTCYDWNCSPGGTTYGYGYMQIFRLYPEGKPDSNLPASTLFAYSHWSLKESGNDEILLGDLANHQQYAAGTTTASVCGIFTTSFPTLNTAAYSVRNIEVWVRGKASLTWAGAAKGTWDTQTASIWSENKAFAAGDAVTFGALTSGSDATVTVPETLSPSTLAITQNTYTFSGDGALVTTTSLSLSENASATFTVPLTTPSVSLGTGTTVNAATLSAEAITLAEGAALSANSLTTSSATIGANGSLTVKALSGLSAVPSGSGTFVYDGGKGNTLTLGHTSANTPKVTVKSGTLVIPTSNSSSVSGSFNPVYTVETGATLQWSGHDLVGWGRTNTTTVAEISGVLEKTGTAAKMNETFSGLLLLKDGGEVRNSGSADYFMLHNSAVIKVEANASAKLTGNSFKSNNGTPILSVGEGATLTVQAPINLAAPLKKEGSGEWVQAQNGLSGTATLTVSAGRLTIERQGGSRIWVASPIAVNEGATLNIRNEVQKDSGATTINGTLTGDGLFYTSAAAASLSITASGRIVPTGALRLQVTGGVSVAPGATIVANGNKLTCTNGLSLSDEGTITIEVPSAAPFSLEPTEIISNIGSLTAEDFSAPTGYTLAKTEAGALTLALAPPPKPEQGEGAAEDTTSWSEAAAKVICELTGGTAPTTVNATTKTGSQTLTAAEASAALEVFQGIAEATADGATVTVAYDFGIAEMTPDGDIIEVIAEVKSGEAAAELAEGTTLSLVQEDGMAIDGVAFSPVEGQSGKYRARVAPSALQKPFKVRATR